MSKRTFLLFFFLLLVTSYELRVTDTYADTIHKKDGSELKGIVVEDYKDRIVFSTADGEVTILKSEIGELIFDTEEDNLVKLAEQAQDRKDYPTAYGYYDMAAKINPESKRAKDGMIFLQGYLFRKGEIDKREAVRRQEEIERYGAFLQPEKSEEDELKENADALRRTIGIVLALRGGFPEVGSVLPKSPAAEAGMRKGDLLVSIWGRLTGYMPLGLVMKVLLEKPSLELKCAIERKLEASIDGASFSMEFDGLTASDIKEGSAAYASGLRAGDLIVAIEGKSTRYLPLKEALGLMRGPDAAAVTLTIRREVLLWRRN